jgi:hypothetical protein
MVCGLVTGPTSVAFWVIHRVSLPSMRNVKEAKFPGVMVFAVFPTMRVSVILGRAATAAACDGRQLTSGRSSAENTLRCGHLWPRVWFGKFREHTAECRACFLHIVLHEGERCSQLEEDRPL